MNTDVSTERNTDVTTNKRQGLRVYAAGCAMLLLIAGSIGTHRVRTQKLLTVAAPSEKWFNLESVLGVVTCTTAKWGCSEEEEASPPAVTRGQPGDFGGTWNALTPCYRCEEIYENCGGQGHPCKDAAGCGVCGSTPSAAVETCKADPAAHRHPCKKEEEEMDLPECEKCTEHFGDGPGDCGGAPCEDACGCGVCGSYGRCERALPEERGSSPPFPSLSPGNLVSFEVRCDTEPRETVVVVGSTAQLGAWKSGRGVRMTTNQRIYPSWRSETLLLSNVSELEYKFVVVGPDGHVARSPAAAAAAAAAAGCGLTFHCRPPTPCRCDGNRWM